ncbi:hypothetical protein QAD02_001745 [Eretmocerus hayati]|uniref:Uncharacterized protein n=1 Tax=Eretmocerus hayati TaxID=131215 RepID=A0ACC2NHT8_9HYME|nr:hypothetical protein QAD02_001745 [Eretmocerus hayati]
MSCIKFPATKTELSKTVSKTNGKDYTVAIAQLIAIANQMLGQSKWSHAITNQSIDFVDCIFGDKYQVGCASIVRVQLDSGVYHESLGYSVAEGSKSSAIQRARLSSFYQAFKNTLMCFGDEITNKLNCLSSRPNSPGPDNVASSTVSKPSIGPPPSDIKVDIEPFEETIPLSQTDALMDIVDLDLICPKDQNSNTVETPKIAPMTGPRLFADKQSKVLDVRTKDNIHIPKTGHSSQVNENKIDPKTDVGNGSQTKAGTSTSIEKPKTSPVNGSGEEFKSESAKPTTVTPNPRY